MMKIHPLVKKLALPLPFAFMGIAWAAPQVQQWMSQPTEISLASLVAQGYSVETVASGPATGADPHLRNTVYAVTNGALTYECFELATLRSGGELVPQFSRCVEQQTP